MLILKYDALADFTQLDVAVRSFRNSKLVGHVGELRAYFDSTAMALISIR
jgi:hypothetical protein